MYYTESVINGVLCSKSTPDGEWEPLSAAQLTKKILHLEAQLKSQNEKFESLNFVEEQL